MLKRPKRFFINSSTMYLFAYKRLFCGKCHINIISVTEYNVRFIPISKVLALPIYQHVKINIVSLETTQIGQYVYTE